MTTTPRINQELKDNQVKGYSEGLSQLVYVPPALLRKASDGYELIKRQGDPFTRAYARGWLAAYYSEHGY